MKNDQYFKLEVHMLDDDKLAGMMEQLNAAESFGVYIALLLHLRQKDNYEGSCGPVSLKVIARRNNFDVEMVKRVINEFGLFEVNEESQTFRSVYLDKVMKSLEEKWKTDVENGKKGGRPRKNKKNAETPASKGRKPNETQESIEEKRISITTVEYNSSNTEERKAPENSVAVAVALSDAVADFSDVVDARFPDEKREQVSPSFVSATAPPSFVEDRMSIGGRIRGLRTIFTPAPNDAPPGPHVALPRTSAFVTPALSGP